jgi:putative ABC transport system permease protein
VFTVIDWMQKSVKDSISTLGESTIYIHKWPWGLVMSINWWDIMKWPNVSENDYEAVLKRSVKSEAACFSITQPRNIKYRNNLASNINLWGVTHEFDKLRSFEISEGRYFTPEESAGGKNVIIIGHEIATRLFENANPVGKEITIQGKKTQVIGVFKKEGKGGITDNGMDEQTVVPLLFARTIVNMRNNFLDATLMIKAKDGVSLEELSDEAVMILRAARRLQPAEINNFHVNQASFITKSFEGVFAGINLAGWVIGGFAILVGGFGIANIMFVSVRERTNIIGIQKALGAKRSFIMFQFLIESILLSVIGGLLGVMMIFIATLFINYIYELNMYLTFANVILAVVISGVIGMVAGYAPAYAAARMNPVEAIGYSFA